ncbi:ATP-binding cassette domain-containing protein, partial [Xanthomonas citri pv. citri]
DIGEVIFEAKHVTCWDVANPNRKRVDDISFQVRRGEIVGIAGLVGAGRTELVSAIFGAYPGRSEAELILEGKPLKVKNPEQAIKAGLSLVPEDRKRQGIVPLLGVGDNITLATLSHYAHAGQIDRQAEMQVIEHEIKRLRVKTASPE